MDPDFDGEDEPKIKLQDAIQEMAENFDLRLAKHLLQGKIKEIRKVPVVKLSIRG